MAVSFGVGAALTLDEFALWLNLEPDAYWSSSGRESIDAVVIFGGLLAVGAWGAPFFQGLHKLWLKRPIFRRATSTAQRTSIRRVRWLRRRRARRSTPHSGS
jgi:hypothetical protein